MANWLWGVGFVLGLAGVSAIWSRFEEKSRERRRELQIIKSTMFALYERINDIEVRATDTPRSPVIENEATWWTRVKERAG